MDAGQKEKMSTIKLWVPPAGFPFVLMFPSASLSVRAPLPLPPLLSPGLAAFLFLKIDITQPEQTCTLDKVLFLILAIKPLEA